MGYYEPQPVLLVPQPRADPRKSDKLNASIVLSGRIDQGDIPCAKRDLCNTARPDRGGIAVADLRVETPAPWWGPWARVGVPSPPVMGRVIVAQVCIGRKRVLPRIDPRKNFAGCTPGTRMTLHHHPDQWLPQILKIQILNSGMVDRANHNSYNAPEVVLIAVASRWPI
ncbi:hypothetical protein PAPYR_9115 [Paratrimastix pyriformis]|uniref:Uncharacterized protein n=1 Tax=Paratrimastix pyriformis TaxID=342808 RepID=A0ABQ8UD71_9EUKA|nr:hypothetical protein PAPYR_9115 [Paratrimastix pyriformis]